MTRKQIYEHFLSYFEKAMPEAKTELNYSTPFQLLVAVILSAQCTDKRVNMITPSLFSAYPTAQQMAEATVDDILSLIKSVSYPNSKASHLSRMSRVLIADYGGQVPDDFDQLIKLPGVGRKTANVMLSVVFNQSAMAVDTHVFRLSHRIGLVPKRCTTPFAVEKELVKNIPSDIIPKAHHWLILHGRYVCKAQHPQCSQCGLVTICRYYSQHSK